MANATKHHFTNWVNGMKIQKDHFIDSENALIENIKQANAFNLNKFNYGLLKPMGANRRSINLQILKSQTNNFKIVLSLCRAITPAGLIIEIVPEYNDEIIYENDIYNDASIDNNVPCYAIVSIDPYNRKPIGSPVDESPARHPYSAPAYQLSMVSENNISLSEFKESHFPIARFVPRSSNELMLDESYFPPCSVIQGHPEMVAIYNNLIEKLNNTQEHSELVIQKIISKSQNFPLAQNINKLCQKTCDYIISIFFDLVNILPHQPPIFIARTIVQLASSLNNTLRLTPEKEKEEMLQYFKEWNDITPSEFEMMLAHVVDLKYDHNNLSKTFAPINNFINKWAEILESLSKNEIGKKKSSGSILIGQKDESSKRKLSFLD